jgi:DNA-binding MarR family transcriptional regulator
LLTDRHKIGTLLAEIVNRISHGSGETLRIMSEAQVSLQQVLLLTRLGEAHPSSATDLAARLNLSLPAISQAIDRLVRLQLVTRIEDSDDRRRKRIEPTVKARTLLARLNTARSREYASGLFCLNSETQARLGALLQETLRQLESKSTRGD